jgi:hypothetical protein
MAATNTTAAVNQVRRWTPRNISAFIIRDSFFEREA